MPDNKRIKRPLDSKRIDIHDPDEVTYWCRSLDCTPSELEEAVKAVGTSVRKVRQWLEMNVDYRSRRTRVPSTYGS